MTHDANVADALGGDAGGGFNIGRRRLESADDRGVPGYGPSTKRDEDLMTIGSEFWLASAVCHPPPSSRSRHGRLLRGDTRNAARRFISPSTPILHLKPPLPRAGFPTRGALLTTHKVE